MQFTSLRAFALSTALALIPATAALAQMAAPPAQEFVTKAATADMFEIESSKLAVAKSSSTDVKSFAEQMITDHTKASEGLKAAVSAAGADLKVPATLDAPHRETIAKLDGLSGKDFDKAYLDEQVAGHKDALALMTAYSEGGDQADLKAHAEKTRPVVQMHFEHVQALDKSVM